MNMMINDNKVSNEKIIHWRDNANLGFSKKDRDTTTILFGGASLLADELVDAAVNSLGIKFKALPNPDFESFQMGKEYGNRGQCNPTYFNVGNLVKYLTKLRDEDGIPTDEIIKNNLFVTAGGCGPCRFGMYITEYRKALNDAGFPNFRIKNVDQSSGIYQGAANGDDGFDFTPKFYITLVKAFVLADILNIQAYKIRPYEVEKGSTDIAIVECKAILKDAFDNKKNLVLAMYRCRKALEKVKLDRLKVKPKVIVMGEFWAAITEGDGNYNLHRFLEQEGAECIPQPLISRLMLSIWEAENELTKRVNLEDTSKKSLDFSFLKKKLTIRSAKWAMKSHIRSYMAALGLKDYEIPNMEAMAKTAQQYFPMDSNGGEAHLEVAHLIESVEKNQAHLVISVKPFGCMPSSSTSDGIQSLIVSKFPQANFLSVETSGEGAVNFYSRVQMALFKAKQSAKDEFEALNYDENTVVPNHINTFHFQPKTTKTGSAAVLVDSMS